MSRLGKVVFVSMGLVGIVLLIIVVRLQHQVSVLSAQSGGEEVLDRGVTHGRPGAPSSWTGSRPPLSEKETVDTGVSPQEIVKQFLEACMDHNYNRALSFWEEHTQVVEITPLDRYPLSQFIQQTMSMTKEEFNELSIVPTENNGMSAVVRVINKTGGGLDFQLVRIDSQWKLIGG